ncbi:MAG: hypothetical protein AAF620_02475 [Bacteroidota bacterium]
MIKSLRYPILAMVFLGVFKLIEITMFDAKKYGSRKEYQDGMDVKNDDFGTKSNSSSVEDTENEKIETGFQSSIRKGKKADSPFLSELKKNYLAPILEKLPPDGLRRDIFIRYYRHNKDGIGVYKLEEMGYYIHQKEPLETNGLGSNIIYYGDNVPLEDIQIVALTLLEEGIPIKSIKHTKFEWKSNAIEIGTDALLINELTISENEIHDFDKQYLDDN